MTSPPTGRVRHGIAVRGEGQCPERERSWPWLWGAKSPWNKGPEPTRNSGCNKRSYVFYHILPYLNIIAYLQSIANSNVLIVYSYACIHMHTHTYVYMYILLYLSIYLFNLLLYSFVYSFIYLLF